MDSRRASPCRLGGQRPPAWHTTPLDGPISRTPRFVVSNIVVTACLAMLLTACDKPPTVEMHEPGVYKGAHDPLLDEAGTDEYQQRLRDRMQMVQTDR